MAQAKQTFSNSYGPWALVTGASDGIGATLSAELAARGLNLILAARRQDRLDAHARSLKATHGIETVVVSVDLSNRNGSQVVMEAIADREVGLYIACAGFGTAGPFIDNAIEDELSMIDVNCRAQTALLQPLARAMAARGRGGIVLMSSIVAFQGVGGSANYAATKAYVQSLAEGLGAELGPKGVDVLSSAPGPVATGFAKRAEMQMGAAAKPEVVARATLKALGKARTTRPGAQSKLLGYGLAALPRRARSLILGRIMDGMTKHRDAAKEKATD